MSRNFEKLSALIDDELLVSEQGNIKNLFKTSENQAYYLRQKMIKDVLHGEKIAILPANFSEQISKKIADEPAIFAPSNLKPTTKLWAKESKQKLIGLALAASVAMVSFVMLQNSSDINSVPAFSSQEVAKIIGPNGAYTNNVANRLNNLNSGYQLASDSRTLNPSQWNGLDKQRYDNYKIMINQYLTAHTEVSTVSNIQGIMPYSKIVGYDSK